MSESKVKAVWMTASSGGAGIAVELEEPTERMTRPPAMAEGTEVGLAPSTHFAVRPVTASGMISPRTPAVNPPRGFVDSRLADLGAAPRELARGSSNRMPPRRPVLDQTLLVRALPRQRGSWLVRIVAFAIASGIGFAVAYVATTLL